MLKNIYWKNNLLFWIDIRIPGINDYVIIFFKFLDIWNEPAGGSCPCTLDPIGLFSYQVTNLVAGQDYVFFMQLTSAYGKKGPVTSFKVSTYTDVVSSIISFNLKKVPLLPLFQFLRKPLRDKKSKVVKKMMKNRHVNRWQKWRKCKTFTDFVSTDFNEIIKLWTSKKHVISGVISSMCRRKLGVHKQRSYKWFCSKYQKLLKLISGNC